MLLVLHNEIKQIMQKQLQINTYVFQTSLKETNAVFDSK